MTGKPSCRVLVVDDDPDIRAMLELALQDEGVEVRAASNGQEALEILQTWHADVILLDLMMPVMDGWTFRERQLADPSLKKIHVILMSANRCLPAAEAVLIPCAMLQKPFDLNVLLPRIGRCATAASSRLQAV